MSKAKVFFTSLALGMSLFMLPGQSSADTYHTVNSGDSLWKISRIYNTTVETITSLNALDSITIYPGQRLLVVPGNSAGDNTVRAAGMPNQVSRNVDRIDEIIDYARSFLGVPYVPAGGSPGGFDCSGYTKFVFAKFGVDLPRTAAQQYHMGQAIPASEARPGDLVAFKTGDYISHIGIYTGNGNFISATSSKGVDITPVYGSYWKDHFLGFSRIIPQ